MAALLLAATFLLVRQPEETKTVTAHFPRAVSVYKGTDVRVLGVNVGRVTAVIPEGNSVRVEMEYDADVDVPKDAKAVVVTPTLVADRFVQLTPVYSSGPAMKDGAEIALPDSGVPVELDRIYASIRDLAEALGPNGVNKDGTLNHLLEAGAERARRPGPARQRDDPPALRGGGDVRRGRRAAVRHRHRARPVHRHAGHQRQAGAGVREGPGRRLGVRWSPSAPRSRRRSPPSPTRWAR